MRNILRLKKKNMRGKMSKQIDSNNCLEGMKEIKDY